MELPLKPSEYLLVPPRLPHLARSFSILSKDFRGWSTLLARMNTQDVMALQHRI